MLKVERIILKGFTGMSLHDIAEFDFTIKSPITIILGGNGSGKTSLLSVYLPVCPPKEDFKDGGSYTNICLVNDTRYKFHVKRTGSTLHCSITNMTTKDEVVTNVNPKVYNANVQDITGLTKEIKDMLNGELSLTRAGTAQRRSWFTLLSTSDLGYALGFYTRLRKHLTALGNQIDYVRGKIAETKTRVVEDTVEREVLETRLKTLEDEINHLTNSLANTPATDPNIDHGYIESIIKEAGSVSRHIVGQDKLIPTETDIGYLNNAIRQYGELVSSWSAVYVERNKALCALVDEQNRQEYLMRDHQGLQTQIADLKMHLGGYDMRDRLYPALYESFFDAEHLQGAAKTAQEFTYTLQTNVDGLTTRDTLKVLQERVGPLDEQIVAVTNHIVRLERLLGEDQTMLQHLRDTDEVSCPNCTHTFKPGVGKLTEADLLQRIDAGTKHKAAKTLELDDAKRVRGEILEEMKRLQTIRELVLTYSRDPILSHLFKKLSEEDAFRVNRQRFGALIQAFFEEITDATVYARTAQQLQKAEKEWEELARAKGNIDTTLADRVAVQREAVDEALREKYRIENELSEAKTRLDKHMQVDAASKRFVELEKKLTNAVRLHANNLAVKQVEDHRAMRWDQYSVARERFRIMQQELDKLLEMEKELERLVSHQHNAKLMVQSFSPEKGVLRRYFFNSIARVTEMMSKYIEHVWSYPMKVLPCDMSEGELDYRFPYTLKDNPEPVFDICKGSAAQRDIFDLAFRLTGYRALGLEQFPLLLDEPGATFDEHHRNELVDFVKMLLNSGQFSQIIVISHNSEVHSKLSGADYCVLESDGITPPPVYNQHVKVTYNE
ncbi:putative SMC domain-containing protein [Erwinia phage vB_EamM_Phobos]|uniref:putative SMC domain-containing protein n=1 Tax=Erwinia phage vB_EamM_Phobos TaxID=1883377 RepID=UPI00081CBBA2|nr:putative SMC domain-containing protein [Erwinia phage vB_EamM_Phobos]ANZ50371.1 putative SMC domain-containing protein [Erwinia phage vB_EamM_Phobos]